MRRLVLTVLLAATSVAATPVRAQEAAATPAADPARLAAARQTIDFIFPLGTYRKMMGSNFGRMMEGVSSQMLDMPVRDLVALGGVPQEEVDRLSGATMRQVMEVLDPAFEQRNKAMFDNMMVGMADVMNGFEPEMREALSEAYAAKFTAVQLGELNRFFATPTGRAYAENAMTLAMDPVFMDKMMKLTPRLMQAMPKIAQDAMARTKNLPPRKSWSTLTQAEKDRLTSLLGVAPTEAQRAVDTLEKQQKKQEAAAS